MSFDAAFDIVVGEEDGYTNNQADPGGETKYGISKKAYPQLDIANLTLEQAKAIYLRDYWHPINGDSLPEDMSLLMFDCAVNQGVSAAERFYSTAKTAVEFQAERALAYGKLATFPTFGRGWMRRLFRVLLASQGSI